MCVMYAFIAPDFPAGLRDKGLLKAELTIEDWGEEGIEYLGEFCVPWHHVLWTIQ